jgi:hypothetical protein
MNSFHDRQCLEAGRDAGDPLIDPGHVRESDLVAGEFDLAADVVLRAVEGGGGEQWVDDGD